MQSHMQGQTYHQQPSKVVRSSTQNPFGNGFSNTTGFSAELTTNAPSISINTNISVGEKRNSSDENADCNMLQSSLKRVRLSRSPGEFRLQRDLKTLDAIEWGSSHVASNALNFATTTWIHRNTGARLTMVDSLRICLFLPMTAAQQNRKCSTSVDPEQQYQHQLHSYHRDYRWRIMIQIPRMYPHSPPVVTRIEGLSLDTIAINELPPGVQHHPSRNDKSKNENDGGASVRSSPGVTTSESLFFTESQLARSTSCKSITSTEAHNGSLAPSVVGNTKVIEWNQWSPITGLGELLTFILGVAESNLSATPLISMMTAISATMNINESKTNFEPSMAFNTSRMSHSSSSSLSSVSSASSISSWGKRFSINHENDRATSWRGGSNAVAETMMSDENATTISIRTNVSGESFLSPNRFDMGYGKSGAGHRFTAAAGMTPRTANTTAWQQHLQFRGKQQGDDDGMDIG